MNTPPASVQRNIPGGGDISMCYFTSANDVKDVDMQDVNPPSINKESRLEKKFVISSEEFAKLSALATSKSSPFTVLKEKKDSILTHNGPATSVGDNPKVVSLQRTSNQRCIRISPKIVSQATSSPVIQTLKSGSKINKIIIVQPGEDIEKVTAKAVNNITDELNKKAADKLANGESPSQETVIEITRICAPADGYFDREALQQKKKAALAQASTAVSSVTNTKQTKTLVVTQSPAHHHHTANQQQSASSKLKSNQFTNVKLFSSQIKQEPNTSTTVGTETLEKLNDSLTNIQWLGKMSGDKVSTNKDTKIIASEEQVNQIAKECGRKKRPPFSYMHLIQMAISSREDKKMTLKEIYKWIEDKFPYYKYCVKQGWKNSIRHNLSLYDIFVRKKSHETQGQTGSSYWTLKPDVDLKIIYRPNSDTANESTANSQTLPMLPIVNQVSATPVIMVQANQTTTMAQNTIVSKPKKGPALLLPKPPPTQTFALIPIQSGIPVIPQHPMVVTGWSHQSTGMLHEKSFTDIKSKGGVKRMRNASESGPIRKQVKIAPKGVTSEESISLLSPPQPSSFLSTQGNTSSLDTSELGKQLSQMKFDSGIDLKSCSDLSMSDVSGLYEQSAVSSALPKPKMYRQKRPRKEKLKVRHDLSFSSGSSEKGYRTPPYQRNETTPRQSKILSIKDGAIHTTGLGDILKSIEKDLTSPARQLLQTPDKAKNIGMLTSTPTKEGVTSPSWISPIKGLTPMSGDHVNLMDSGIFTPGKDGKVCTSTPFQSGMGASPAFKDLGASPPFKNCESSPRFHFSSDKLSPRPGSLRSLGLPGLTPLKGTLVLGNPEDSPNGSLKNDSFMRIFDGVQLESFMDDDVNNLSFGSLS